MFFLSRYQSGSKGGKTKSLHHLSSWKTIPCLKSHFPGVPLNSTSAAEQSRILGNCESLLHEMKLSWLWMKCFLASQSRKAKSEESRSLISGSNWLKARSKTAALHAVAGGREAVQDESSDRWFGLGRAAWLFARPTCFAWTDIKQVRE